VFYWTYLARHICQCFDADPAIRPKVTPSQGTKEAGHQIALSKAQEDQIREIFDLFDTDGGGTIDSGELTFAMEALGFRNKASKFGASEAEAAMEEIAADGVVTLEEFSSLMMGQLSGRDPKENMLSVFAVLSQSEGGEFVDDKGITLEKLETVCDMYKVRHPSLPLVFDLCASVSALNVLARVQACACMPRCASVALSLPKKNCRSSISWHPEQ
jgi:Ca2+-binding EF-hand superfamily protein